MTAPGSSDSNRRIAPPPRIVVRGDSTTRGRQYGQQASNRIHHSIKAYRTMFEVCDISWTNAQQQALQYVGAIEQIYPDLLDELQGIAEGSGIDFASLMALNCRTEILPPDYLVRASQQPAESLPDAGHISECTALAVARDNNPVWLAQNWDWVGSQRDALVMVEAHPDDGPAYLTVTEAGMLAKIGLNEHGVGVTLNILRSSNDGQQTGMPVHVLLRGLLGSSDARQASEQAAALQFAGSSNILMADDKGYICSLEMSPSGARILPSDGNQLCHTNHFLHADLAGSDAALTGNISTESRLGKAREQLDGINNFDGICTLLSDTSDGLQSVCRYPDQSLPPEAQIETVVAVAMDLTNRSLWVSGAQPADTPFTNYRLQ